MGEAIAPLAPHWLRPTFMIRCTLCVAEGFRVGATSYFSP
jgi:hypothetical protein